MIMYAPCVEYMSARGTDDDDSGDDCGVVAMTMTMINYNIGDYRTNDNSTNESACYTCAL